MTFAAPYIQGGGYEGTLAGTLITSVVGKISAPIKGSMGVYVFVLLSTEKPKAQTAVEIKTKQTTLIQGVSSRVDGSSAEILKDNGAITDNRAKHF